MEKGVYQVLGGRGLQAGWTGQLGSEGQRESSPAGSGHFHTANASVNRPSQLG